MGNLGDYWQIFFKLPAILSGGKIMNFFRSLPAFSHPPLAIRYSPARKGPNGEWLLANGE